jgi:hypothetical protein
MGPVKVSASFTPSQFMPARGVRPLLAPEAVTVASIMVLMCFDTGQIDCCRFIIKFCNLQCKFEETQHLNSSPTSSTIDAFSAFRSTSLVLVVSLCLPAFVKPPVASFDLNAESTVSKRYYLHDWWSDEECNPPPRFSICPDGMTLPVNPIATLIKCKMSMSFS